MILLFSPCSPAFIPSSRVDDMRAPDLLTGDNVLKVSNVNHHHCQPAGKGKSQADDTMSVDTIERTKAFNFPKSRNVPEYSGFDRQPPSS